MDANAHIVALDKRFGIPGSAQVIAGNGGLPLVRIDNAAAKADVYLYGAQVTSWQPAGAEEVLFVSRDSYWEEGRPIRGGIPICLPWFGDKTDDANAPKHGFVRTREWRLDSLSAGDDGSVTLICVIENPAANPQWPHEFFAAYRITIGSSLRLELSVVNTGSTPMRFEEALHSYLRVGNVQDVQVRGLAGTQYLDKTDGYRQKLQGPAFAFQELTDRVFVNTEEPVEIVDASLRRRIRTEKKNSATSVVWNPWREQAASLPDFGADEWREMVCIEASNVLRSAILLDPGEEHLMRSHLTVNPA